MGDERWCVWIVTFAQSIQSFWVELIWRVLNSQACDRKIELSELVVRSILGVFGGRHDCGGFCSPATGQLGCVKLYEVLPEFSIVCGVLRRNVQLSKTVYCN
tara:strand:+ start:1165 stop:1470 length:306 start_codon:yes stop_codon:yes gene_type:complete